MGAEIAVSQMKKMRRSRTTLSRVFATLLALWLAGCATPTPIPGASRDLLKFLQIGKTTREEVLLKLGQPSASFEHEKILTYRVGEDIKQGFYVVNPRAMMPWEQARYSLVLVFDEGGILQKQSRVAVD